MALRIVTDSTCDLPKDVAERLRVTVVPCDVHFGGQVLRDGVDIQPREFYERLMSDGAQPTTSQPSVGTFLEVYRRLAKEADEVLSVHVSSKLSGTLNSATQAKRELGDRPRVEVFDSQQVSLGLGLLVAEAARMAQRGGTLDEARAFLERAAPRVTSYCSVDTLEYLVRGGRASRLQGFFGSLLDIKPIIVVRDGEAHPVERVRSRRRVLERFKEIVAASRDVRALAVIHSARPEEAERLAAQCSAFFPKAELLVSEFSAVMGVHLGPGALGVAIWSGAPPAP